MNALISGLDLVLAVLRTTLFAAALVVAGGAALSWGVRTRRLSPFGAVGRFVRGAVDPLFVPAERRLLRSGGRPTHAPWWTLGAFVVGAIVVLSLLGFLRGQLIGAALAVGAGPIGIVRLLVVWTFAALQIALLVRVVASWVQLSPYSPWVRWAFALTEWFMRPLRQLLPTLGPIDLSPLVAYFGLSILQRLVLGLL